MSRSANLDPELDVTVIIISYNTREMTLACLSSLVAETRRVRYEVIVVDNASADGSAEAIKRQFPQFVHLPQSKNLGFAAANNLAAQCARGSFLLLLNPDTVVLRGAIDEIVDFALRRPEAGIWGGRTLFGNGQLNPTSCWARVTLWSLFCRNLGISKVFPNLAWLNPESYGGWKRDTEREVDIVTGCFFLIRREFWNALGGFNLEFFMYGEEADLCLRAKVLGARPAITPKATIIHYGGATDENHSRKNKRNLAAKALLIRKHFSPAVVPVALTLLAVRPWVKRVFTGGPRREVWKEVWSDRRTWLAGHF